MLTRGCKRTHGPGRYEEPDDEREPQRPAQRRRATSGAGEDSRPRSNGIDPKEMKDKGIAADIFCPLTCRLPVDPVSTEDGRIYEKRHVLNCAEVNSVDLHTFTSPWTKQPISKRVQSLMQVKQLIDAQIAAGVFTPDVQYEYEVACKNEEIVRELERGAQHLPAHAIKLGHAYRKGALNLPVNKKTAYKYYRMFAEMGCVESMTYTALCILRRKFVLQERYHAWSLLGGAASKGSRFASFVMGCEYASGECVPDACMFVTIGMC